MPGVAPVVVGLDGSPSSLSALRTAIGMATTPRRPLRVVTAWSATVGMRSDHVVTGPPDDAWHIVDRAVRTATLELPCGRPSGAVLEGAPAGVLIEESHHACMLVIGAGSARETAALGSVAAVTAARSHCSVLIVRQDPASFAGDRASPVDRA